MFLRKTIPVFTAATLDSNIRSLTLSVGNAYHTLDPIKTNQDPLHGREDVSSSNKISIDFEQTKDAYQSKDTLELLRSLFVFKLCSYDILVDKNKEVCNAFNTCIESHYPLKMRTSVLHVYHLSLNLLGSDRSSAFGLQGNM